jgi:GNAT superfamily N-acetyltransferase
MNTNNLLNENKYLIQTIYYNGNFKTTIEESPFQFIEDVKTLKIICKIENESGFGEINIENNLNDKIYGYTGLNIVRLKVTEQCRHKGIANELMNVLIDYADKRKFNIFFSPYFENGVNKTRLEDFFYKLGFEKNNEDLFIKKQK